MVAPLFTIVPLKWEAPDPGQFDAVLLTSANAARCGGPNLARYASLPCWAVGGPTAAAARAAGFADVRAGPSDGAALAKTAADAGVRRALHLRGREHVPLSAPGLSIVGRAVYAAEAATELPDEAGTLRDAVVMLHSQRAASLFSSLVAGKTSLALAARTAPTEPASAP